MKLERGTRLKHYKGGLYRVITPIANHSETLEEMVVYQNEVDHKVWVRPLNMFYDYVEYKGQEMPRFTIIKE